MPTALQLSPGGAAQKRRTAASRSASTELEGDWAAGAAESLAAPPPHAVPRAPLLWHPLVDAMVHELCPLPHVPVAIPQEDEVAASDCSPAICAATAACAAAAVGCVALWATAPRSAGLPFECLPPPAVALDPVGSGETPARELPQIPI